MIFGFFGDGGCRGGGRGGGGPKPTVLAGSASRADLADFRAGLG